MASLPARLITDLLARAFEPLLNPGPVKVYLDTGRLLTRVELVTEPAICKTIIPINLELLGDVDSVCARDMPPCLVEYIDYYDQNGDRFLRERFMRVVCRGDTVHIPLRFSVSG